MSWLSACEWFCFVLFCFDCDMTTQKFMVAIDLSEADCKEEVNVRIGSEFLVGDNAGDEKWFDAFSDVLDGIETKLNNNEWAKSFELFATVDNTFVDDLNKFINAVKQQLSKDNKAFFCIKVNVFNITVFCVLLSFFSFLFLFFFCFFFFYFFLFVHFLLVFCLLYFCCDTESRKKNRK